MLSRVSDAHTVSVCLHGLVVVSYVVVGVESLGCCSGGGVVGV